MLRTAKHRVELRVDGNTVVVMPGQSYDFDSETAEFLDSRSALEPLKEQDVVKAEPAPVKRGRKKQDVEPAQDDDLGI